MKKAIFVSLFFAVAILLNSCSDSEKESMDNFDRKLILENLADNLIIPAYSNLENGLETLSNNTSGISKEFTREKFENIKEQWKLARIAWASAEPFTFGPIEELNFTTKINNWPVNDFGLEKTLEAQADINEETVQTLPSDQVGFPTIEYLLFADKAFDKLQESEKRREMLIAQTSRLYEISKRIHSAWNTEYKTQFVANTGRDVGGSITVFANAYLQSIEVLRTFKLSTPLGFRTDGETQEDLVETPFSNLSLLLVVENLESFKRIFNGNGAAGNGNGFDDYLNELNIQYEGELLSEVINNQYEKAIQSIADINFNLQEAVNQEPLKVNASLSEIQKLIVLLKTDMMSQLSLIVTFSDADGD